MYVRVETENNTIVHVSGHRQTTRRQSSGVQRKRETGSRLLWHVQPALRPTEAVSGILFFRAATHAPPLGGGDSNNICFLPSRFAFGNVDV